MKNKITIGLIIPCRNEERNIATCLNSLTSQKEYINQIIFIDDESSDKSIIIAEKLLKKFKNYELIKLKKRIGPIKIANLGLKYIKTDYVLYLASNDYLNAPIIADTYKILNKRDIRPGIITAMCKKNSNKTITIHNSPILSFRKKFFNAEDCDKYSFKLGNWITGPTTIYNTYLLKKIRGFNNEYYGLTDLFISIHLASMSGALYLPKIYGVISLHEGFQYKTISSSKKIKEIITLINKDNRSKIFSSPEFKKRMIERIIYSSLIAGAEFSENLLEITKQKHFLLSKFKLIKILPLKKLLFFIILRPYDILPFFKYRYIKHFIFKIKNLII